jgi:hypothetical protein
MPWCRERATPLVVAPTGDNLLTGLLRFALRALACKSCACLPALRFPAALGRPGQTLRGLPVRRAKGPLDPWQFSGSPMASPFAGASVHRVLTFTRLTHPRPKNAYCLCRLPANILIGFSHPKARYFLVATRKYPKKRSPGFRARMASPFAGASVQRTLAFSRLTPRPRA